MLQLELELPPSNVYSPDPWRLVERRFYPRPAGPVRDALRGLERLPRAARQLRRRGSRLPERDPGERLPRDLAHRLRGGGPWLRQDRSDHPQCHRRQGHQALRGRRAVLPAHRQPARVRAGARYASGNPRPKGPVGDSGGEAGVHQVAPAGFPGAPAPGGDQVRGHRPERRGAGHHLVQAPLRPESNPVSEEDPRLARGFSAASCCRVRSFCGTDIASRWATRPAAAE